MTDALVRICILTRPTKGSLTLQEQEPGAQVHEVQVQEAFPQPPILIDCLMVVIGW
jgi:hypothetical protein